MEVSVSFSLPDDADREAVAALSEELITFVAACSQVFWPNSRPVLKFTYPTQQALPPTPAAASLPGGTRSIPFLGRVS